MSDETLRVFIGKHPCDDLPYIVGTDPDPRDSGWEPFKGLDGIDYSGWYVKVEPPDEQKWRLVWMPGIQVDFRDESDDFVVVGEEPDDE
jgi:hypothetical protein